MTITADELPDDLNALKAMVLSREAENARLRQIIKELQRHRFGRRAETLPEDQLLLGLEEAEQVEAAGLEDNAQASPSVLQAQVANGARTEVRCQHICRASRSRSISMTMPAPAAATTCIGLARMSARSSTLCLPSSACWWSAAQSMPAGPARRSLSRLRHRQD